MTTRTGILAALAALCLAVPALAADMPRDIASTVLATITTLVAVSTPSTSVEGSVSAKPSFCASAAKAISPPAAEAVSHTGVLADSSRSSAPVAKPAALTRPEAGARPSRRPASATSILAY